MKRLILSIALVAAGAAAYAQIGQGTMMLGGSLGFSSTGGGTGTYTPSSGPSLSNTIPAQTNWNFTPTFGYFLTDKIAGGLMLDISSRWVKTVTAKDQQTTTNIGAMNIGVTLFGRYYMSVSDKVYMFTQLGIGYSNYGYTDKSADTSSMTTFKDGNQISNSTISVMITPGIAYFVNNNWGFDFAFNNLIGFSSNSNTTTYPNSGGKMVMATSDFGINLGLTPSLGLFYYMGGGGSKK
ncbi:MAG: outer membrane beta-barrel protein [Bacteroidia bacterium]